MDITTIILLVLSIGIIIFWISRRRKKKRKQPVVSKRKQKDEVIKTIKEYLKSSGRYGYEIIDAFPVKRVNEDYINPRYSKEIKNKIKAEYKIRKMLKTPEVKQPEKNIPDDIYVISFTVRNPKKNEQFPPEAIECKLVKKRGENAKEIQQKIVVTKALDFNKEMEWIAPIRGMDHLANEKSNFKAKALEQQRAMNQLYTEERSRIKNAK